MKELAALKTLTHLESYPLPNKLKGSKYPLFYDSIEHLSELLYCFGSC